MRMDKIRNSDISIMRWFGHEPMMGEPRLVKRITQVDVCGR